MDNEMDAMQATIIQLQHRILASQNKTENQEEKMNE
jgi:hypothetical protein